MSAAVLFVTGTDTGVGKTHVAAGLVRRLRHQGRQVCGYKPVASGCVATAGGLRNEDALALMAESTGKPDYAAVNPVALEPPIAPHLAARRAGLAIELATLDRGLDALAERYDTIVVEGAGGWSVPINDQNTYADWVAGRQWPVLLVVGMRLGCINHALLSAEAIARRTPLLGWVANLIPPMQAEWQDNVDTLRAMMPAPCWGVVPTGSDLDAVGAALAPSGHLPWADGR